MIEKHEWRKKEKQLYIPKNRPEVIEVPELKFLSLRGEGSPDEDAFTTVVVALYSLSYGIKMGCKKLEQKPQNYFDFTVYPLEGVWDINEKARQNFTGTVNKKDFVYQMMIRQPDFVTKDLFTNVLELTKAKKPNALLDKVQFESICEGKCVQMLHLGPFADEPASFDQMEAFANKEGLVRQSKVHREIYLSDLRKVAPEKLKTVLRFKV